MKTKWISLTVLITGVAAVALWYFVFYYSPERTLRRVDDAMQVGDQYALERDIDFPALRAHLKEQFARLAFSFPGTGLKDHIAENVDVLVTPKGVSQLKERTENGGKLGIDYGSYARESNGYVSYRVPSGGKIVLKRQWAGWRVVDFVFDESFMNGLKAKQGRGE